MTKCIHIPSDQFTRCTEELRKLCDQADLLGRAINVADNIDSFEARRAIAFTQNNVKTASFWLIDALKFLDGKPSAVAAVRPFQPASDTFGQ